jgi:hypothetical protein
MVGAKMKIIINYGLKWNNENNIKIIIIIIIINSGRFGQNRLEFRTIWSKPSGIRIRDPKFRINCLNFVPDGFLQFLNSLKLSRILEIFVVYLVLESLLYWLNSIIHIFCDYMNDCYTTVLIDIWSIGLDRSCLGKTDCTAL